MKQPLKNQLKFLMLLSLRKRYYETLGISGISRPMSPSSLGNKVGHLSHFYDFTQRAMWAHKPSLII